jgi:predicted  nucleic acid-binding Zn-ribbon protein
METNIRSIVDSEEKDIMVKIPAYQYNFRKEAKEQEEHLSRQYKQLESMCDSFNKEREHIRKEKEALKKERERLEKEEKRIRVIVENYNKKIKKSHILFTEIAELH